MTPHSHAARAGTWLACCILLACVPARADTQVRNATSNGAPGSVSVIKGYPSPDAKEVPAAATFNIPVSSTPHGGIIATPNVAQPALAANPARRAGYCQADPRNTDILAFSFGGTASTAMGAANACIVRRGGTCPMTIGGNVFTGAITVASPTAGQGFNCPDFQ